jgi:hypothetical protein
MNIAFIHIHKTGGGSVIEWFNRNNLNNKLIFYGHKDLNQIKSLTSQNIDISFCVVRNTYERLISAYEFTYQKVKKKIFKNNNIEINQKILDTYNNGIISFVEYMHSINHVTTRNQLEFSQGVDFILHNDQLSKYNKLNELFKIDNIIKKERRVNTYEDKSYYTNGFIDTVNTLYREEINYFDFTPKYK